MRAILEKIPVKAEQSFSFFEFKCRRFNCPFHYHPEIELTHIAAGTGQRYVGDHVGRFGPGDLVLMGPDLPHMYVSDPKGPARSHSQVLQFLPACLGGEFFRRGELKAIRRLLERARVGLAFHGRARDQAVQLLARLGRARDLERLLLFLQILELLARAGECRPLASPSHVPMLSLYQGERINRACALISERFREGLTQAEAARAARMSVPSFSRFFRRATNKTFRAFVNEVRVGYACQQLLESDRTVAEICYEAGYGNLSNFNRRFRELRKVSPRDYRRRSLNS